MRAGLVGADDEKADTVRAAAHALRSDLRLVGHLDHQAPHLHRLVVDVPVVDALRAHVLGEHARVGHQAGDANADVVVDLEDLFLVRRQLRRGALQRRHDRKVVRPQADARTALLHRLHCILNLVDAPGRRPGDAVGIVLVAKHARGPCST